MSLRRNRMADLSAAVIRLFNTSPIKRPSPEYTAWLQGKDGQAYLKALNELHGIAPRWGVD